MQERPQCPLSSIFLRVFECNLATTAIKRRVGFVGQLMKCPVQDVEVPAKHLLNHYNITSLDEDQGSSSRTPSPYDLFSDTETHRGGGDQSRLNAPAHPHAERDPPVEPRQNVHHDNSFEPRRSQPLPGWLELPSPTEPPPRHSLPQGCDGVHRRKYSTRRNVLDVNSAAAPLPRRGSDDNSEEELVPPTPPRRKRRRLLPTQVYPAYVVGIEEDINEGWYCPGQKMY